MDVVMLVLAVLIGLVAFTILRKVLGFLFRLLAVLVLAAIAYFVVLPLIL